MDSSAFTLGQIIVTARPAQGTAISGATVNSEAIYAFNRNSLDDAANLIPGVVASNSGGSRNERLLFVRGFDRFQVPLSIDGIRVYLPADNRLDYGRFLTPDIAEIQVAKGYPSVLDGPGALGGAVNLVTRKPTQKLEVEARGTLSLDRGLDYAGYNAFGLIGTRQDHWYAQASFTRNFQDHWDLPGGYVPAAGTAENGGERDFSRTSDWRVNAKLGFMPSDFDEYSISYTRQEGAKNAPLHVTDPIATPLPAGAPAPRFWTWPHWNIDSIYFLSKTALGATAALKTRIYRNTFDNLLRSFDNAAQTTQTLGRAFNSYYEDEAFGGSAQLDVDLTPADTFRLAVHYRRDIHVEYQQGFPSGATEPHQKNKEDTFSIAGENRLAFSPRLALTVGASYDWRDLKQAEDYGTPPTGGAPRIFSYPLANVGGWNAQGRLDYTPDATSRLHASLSSRMRFPTIFERFSTQFGTAASNPSLKPERATTAELGASQDRGVLHVEGAVFYSDLADAIVAVRPSDFPANTSQRRNLGNGTYYGGELAVSVRMGTTLSIGANYSYIRRTFDIAPQQGVTVPVFALTDVPTHKSFIYADWSPTERLHIVPNVDLASDRTTLDTFVPATPAGTVRYYRTGSYVQANVRIDYELVNGVQVGIGARNLFEDSYQLADGFPEASRSIFVSVRGRY